MAYNTSSTSIMVTWQSPLTPNGMIRGYQVNYFVTGGNGATSVVDTNVTDSTVLTGLSIYTNYTIFVRAKTVTLGDNSISVMVSTNEDGKYSMCMLIICIAFLIERLQGCFDQPFANIICLQIIIFVNQYNIEHTLTIKNQTIRTTPVKKMPHKNSQKCHTEILKFGP